MRAIPAAFSRRIRGISHQRAVALLTAFFVVTCAILYISDAFALRGRGLLVSGRVEVKSAGVGSKIGGRVEQVFFNEGDMATSGSLIIQLERTELEAALAQAEALAAQARARLDLLLAGTRAEEIRRAEEVVASGEAALRLRRKGFRKEEVSQARAELEAAGSANKLAQRDLERAREMKNSGAISQQELDKVRTAADAASANLKVAREREDLVESGSRPEEIEQAAAQLEQAKADLSRLKNGARVEEIAAAQAELDAARANAVVIATHLDECQIRAPFDGMIETLDLHPGDLVRAYEVVATVDLVEQPYVRCYIPENRLGEVKPGMKVAVTVDSFPDEKFPGIVRHVAAEAEFTPSNIQTSEKRSELVFEMKVDVDENGQRLRAGMYADVHVGKAP